MAKWLFALLALVTLASAACASPEAMLYAGKSMAESQLSAAPWGAGSVQDSTDVFLFGGHSLKVTTLDLYQGAQVAFASPVPLATGEQGRIFQLTLRRGVPTLHYDPRTLPGAGAGNGAGTNPAAPYPGSGSVPGRGRRRRTNPDGTPAISDAPVTIPPVANLRLLFTLSDGRQADVFRPIPKSADPSLGEGWYSVAVPLNSLKFAGGTAGTLQSITIGGDQFGVFYVGRMRLATDTAPITASIDGLETIAPNAPVTLRAKTDGGLSTLKYDWSFDGGSADQADGPTAKVDFSRPGHDYNVMLTVSDVDGLKSSVSATKKIHVMEAPQGPRNNGAPFGQTFGQPVRQPDGRGFGQPDRSE